MCTLVPSPFLNFGMGNWTPVFIRRRKREIYHLPFSFATQDPPKDPRQDPRQDPWQEPFHMAHPGSVQDACPGGGGELEYKKGRGARRLAYGL